VTHHDALSAERWSQFDLGQQILQIGVELQRGLKHLRPDRAVQLRSCYERSLELVDLTVQVQTDPHLRRELLLWRDIVGELYLSPEPATDRHRQALRVLLRLHPDSARQVAILGL
jgi:hypothetical protein